jgi:hypothetical protein
MECNYEDFEARKNSFISGSLDVVVKSSVTGNYFNDVSIDPVTKAYVILYMREFGFHPGPL